MEQRLAGPSKQLKQMIQIEHNIVKNPNCPEANKLAIYKRGRGFELGATVKQIQVVVRARLEPATSGFQVRRPNHSATLSQYSLDFKSLFEKRDCAPLPKSFRGGTKTGQGPVSRRSRKVFAPGRP